MLAVGRVRVTKELHRRGAFFCLVCFLGNFRFSTCRPTAYSLNSLVYASKYTRCLLRTAAYHVPRTGGLSAAEENDAGTWYQVYSHAHCLSLLVRVVSCWRRCWRRGYTLIVNVYGDFGRGA